MAVIKQVNTESPDNLRDASEFYPIHLDNTEYILTNEVLLENVSEKTIRAKEWYYPDLHFLRFKGKRLELQCSHDKTSYKLSFIIEKDCLLVACSCRREVEKLCLHAYRVLSKLMPYFSKRTSYFQDYAPKGLAKTAFANKKYFDFKNTNAGLEIQAKAPIGFVYSVTNCKRNICLRDVLSLFSKEMAPGHSKNDRSLCYMILVPRKPYIMPFVLPFLGEYNKPHTSIKAFGKFLSGLDKENEFIHTAEQKLINELCLELYKEVEHIPELFKEDQETGDQKPQSSTKILSHWCRIFHLLQGQHVYTHAFWQHKYLKRGPQKSYTDKVIIRLDVPELQFHLTEYGRYYQIRMEILINGKPVKEIESACSFLLKHGDTLYLLRSFEDAAIVDWFYLIDNKLTIFKEQFKDFEDAYLKTLKINYPVHIKRLTRSKK